MMLALNGSNDLLSLLLEKMSRFGICYKVNKYGGSNHSSVSGTTDIESMEKTIAELETEISQNPNEESIEFLMDLYVKVSLLSINYRLLNTMLLIMTQNMKHIKKKFRIHYQSLE